LGYLSVFLEVQDEIELDNLTLEQLIAKKEQLEGVASFLKI
jgi:hypothetical protein